MKPGGGPALDGGSGQEAWAQREPPPPAPARHLSAPWLLLWLLVAAVVPVMVALLGVFARYLQVTTDPPFPPLRFTSMLNLLALPTLLLFHTLPHCLLRWHRRRCCQCSGSTGTVEVAAVAQKRADGSGIDGGNSPGRADSIKQIAVDWEDGESPPAAEPAASTPAAPASIAPIHGPSLPGLARLHSRHPAAHRAAVLLVLASCYEAAILGQNVAPGLVDPAVVMLVSMFTVVGVALLARLWLKSPLRWALVVPAATVMIGGAGMVLGPDIKAGAGEPGSLTTGRAWLGFAASVGAMMGNTSFIVLAQAYKDSNITAIETQWTIIWMNLLIVLPVSLGVDGTDWAAQFGGMGAKDWGALIYCGCVAHAWVALLIQESTARLGGLLVSMFFGLRLIGSVVASKIVLGVTLVQTAVQVVGIVLVALAITVYTGVQWRTSQAAASQSRKQSGAGQ